MKSKVENLKNKEPSDFSNEKTRAGILLITQTQVGLAKEMNMIPQTMNKKVYGLRNFTEGESNYVKKKLIETRDKINDLLEK